MSLFEEIKSCIESNMSPNQRCLSKPTDLWLRALCSKVEDRLDAIEQAVVADANSTEL